MEYDYSSNSGGEFAMALLVGFLFVGVIGLVLYVINSFFLMKLLKNAGHKTPVSAWVPLWQTASLMEVGGIRKAWIWTLVLFGGSFIGGSIPVVGTLVAIAVFVAAVVLTVFLAKGVQAGLGIDSIGGIVLAVLVPIVWIVWMGIASGKTNYNREAAIAQGGAMPMNWFGDSDPYEPFANAGSTYGQPSSAYSQPTSGYGQNSGYSQQSQGWAAPGASAGAYAGYDASTGSSTTEAPKYESPKYEAPDYSAPSYGSSSKNSTPEGYDAPSSGPSASSSSGYDSSSSSSSADSGSSSSDGGGGGGGSD